MFGGDKTREFQKGMDQPSLRRRREEERLSVRRKWREEQLQHKRRHVMQFGIAKGKTEPCRFYNMPPNGCRYGTNCRYSHDSKEQPICPYFTSYEGCRYGNQCRYKHEGKRYQKPPKSKFAIALESGDWKQWNAAFTSRYGERLNSDMDSDDYFYDRKPIKPSVHSKEQSVQLRFDCVGIQTKDKWKFRRFTTEEQAKYNEKQTEIETESDHLESDCITYDSQHECSSDDKDSKPSDDFNPDDYWSSAHDCYVKDDPHPDIVRLAKCRDLEGIKKYIANGGDLDKRQKWTEVQEKWGYDKSWEWFNNSALMVAAQKGFVEIVYELLVNQADPMLKSCWTDDEYHTALEAAQNVRVNDTEDMKKIIAMITVVHDLWKKLNPNCNESAHYSTSRRTKNKPSQTLIQNAIVNILS